MEALDRATLAMVIDHTLLTPEATAADIVAFCAEADELAVGAICVSPNWVSLAHKSTRTPVASVVGFPSGSHLSVTKASEAARAVSDGASEIDMVANLGWIAGGDWSKVENEVAEVRKAIGAHIVLKVILETGLWSSEQIAAACKHSVSGGADYVKTSTGFHKVGGASLEAVQTMRNVVGADIGVKASGGIRTTADALAMIEAGASRIGASATRAILNGVK
jgi:deoxyribose-phosphate aldolase